MCKFINGSDFEDKMAEMLSRHFSVTEFQNTLHSSLDEEWGTDGVILGVRMDYTINFSGKDNMVKFPTIIQVQYRLNGEDIPCFIHFGVRYANRTHVFQIPVLVFGADAWGKGIGGYAEQSLVDSIESHIDSIIDVGQSLYWDWLDANEIEIV